eukprot:1894275-Pyramimonas_sp.AAC.1
MGDADVVGGPKGKSHYTNSPTSFVPHVRGGPRRNYFRHSLHEVRSDNMGYYIAALPARLGGVSLRSAERNAPGAFGHHGSMRC